MRLSCRRSSSFSASSCESRAFVGLWVVSGDDDQPSGQYATDLGLSGPDTYLQSCAYVLQLEHVGCSVLQRNCFTISPQRSMPTDVLTFLRRQNTQACAARRGLDGVCFAMMLTGLRVSVGNCHHLSGMVFRGNSCSASPRFPMFGSIKRPGA